MSSGDDVTGVRPKQTRTGMLRAVGRSSTGLRVAAGIVGVVCATTAAAWWLASDDEPVDPAALRPTVTYASYPLRPGGAFTIGSLNIRTSGVDVEILEVRPYTSTNVEYLGSVAIWPRDMTGPQIGFAEGFPPAGQARHHSALGVVVPAAELTFRPPGHDEPADLFVAAGFRMREGTVGAVNGITVVYRAGNRNITEHFRQAAVACVRPKSNCPSDEELEPILRELGVLRDHG